MGTDRELLELAAKAAGYEINDTYNEPYFPVNCKPDAKIPSLLIWNLGVWNPLTDDGNALRLAVKLGIGLTTDTTYVDIISADYVCDDVGMVTEVTANGDVYAATRRAIVQAAAAIGKGMK